MGIIRNRAANHAEDAHEKLGASYMYTKKQSGIEKKK
jgi:hypothetical protein